MKLKPYVLISVLVLLTIVGCSEVDFLQPGDQLDKSTWVQLQNGGAGSRQVIFTAVSEQEAVENNPKSSNSAYIYVAELKKTNTANTNTYLFSAAMTTNVDHKQNIADSGYEIIRIWYYLAEFNNMGKGEFVKNTQYEVLEVVKTWCFFKNWSYNCAMP